MASSDDSPGLQPSDAVRLSETPHTLHDILSDVDDSPLRIELEGSSLEVVEARGEFMVEVVCRDSRGNFEWRRNQSIAEVKEYVGGENGDPVLWKP